MAKKARIHELEGKVDSLETNELLASVNPEHGIELETFCTEYNMAVEQNTSFASTITRLTDEVDKREEELEKLRSDLEKERLISQQYRTELDEKEARLIELSKVEKELTDANQTLEEQERGREYLLGKVSIEREKVATAHKMVDTLNILGKYLLDKVSRIEKRKEGIEVSGMQVKELGSRIRVTDWNVLLEEIEEQSSEVVVIDTLIKKYSKSKATGSEEVITEAQTLRKCIIQYQKEPLFKVSASSEVATAMENYATRKRPPHASKDTIDGIDVLEDEVNQSQIDDYAIDVEDSSRTEKRSKLTNSK
jgi:hypothetical protein